MSAGPGRPAPRRERVARAAFERAAAAAWGAAELGGCWLDGGPAGRGLFGLGPCESLGPELSALAALPAGWRTGDPELGGWLGHVGYDAAADALLGRSVVREGWSGIRLTRYAVVVETRPAGPGTLDLRWYGHPEEIRRARATLVDRADHPAPAAGWPFGPLAPCTTRDEHRARFAAIGEALAAGESYQVNLSSRWHAAWGPQVDGPAARASAVLAAWAWLREHRPAARAALLRGPGERWALSNSPETLAEVWIGAAPAGGDLVLSAPIKGTRPRAAEPAADAALARALLESDKDAVEHRMIVDLVRHDLGCVARPGTVWAPRAPTLTALPTVHHLVSTIRAVLREGWTELELFQALAPGGSVTGAPKRRTVELIAGLEGEPRGLYCGSVVAITPGRLVASLAIRTAELDAEGLTVRAGGGIVADSRCDDEWDEQVAKLAAFRGPDRSWAG